MISKNTNYPNEYKDSIAFINGDGDDSYDTSHFHYSITNIKIYQNRDGYSS
jgi:hypothetical protein